MDTGYREGVMAGWAKGRDGEMQEMSARVGPGCRSGTSLVRLVERTGRRCQVNKQRDQEETNYPFHGGVFRLFAAGSNKNTTTILPQTNHNTALAIQPFSGHGMTQDSHGEIYVVWTVVNGNLGGKIS